MPSSPIEHYLAPSAWQLRNSFDEAKLRRELRLAEQAGRPEVVAKVARELARRQRAARRAR